MYDVHAVRRDFPILSREVNGKPLVRKVEQNYFFKLADFEPRLWAIQIDGQLAGTERAGQGLPRPLGIGAIGNERGQVERGLERHRLLVDEAHPRVPGQPLAERHQPAPVPVDHRGRFHEGQRRAPALPNP